MSENMEKPKYLSIKKIQKYNVKDVLLIGGTGYLGIHILYEYLKYENGKIFINTAARMFHNTIATERSRDENE